MTAGLGRVFLWYFWGVVLFLEGSGALGARQSGGWPGWRISYTANGKGIRNEVRLYFCNGEGAEMRLGYTFAFARVLLGFITRLGGGLYITASFVVNLWAP